MREFFCVCCVTYAWGLWVLAPVSPAQAQVQPGILLEQQRQSEEQRKQQEQRSSPQAPPQIDRPSLPIPPPDAPPGDTILVTRFLFTGHTLFSQAELEAVVADAVGRSLTLRALNAMVTKVSAHYRAQGYLLAKAYLPPQEPQDGVITITILEGRVGAITVTGNERYASATILRRLALLRTMGEGILHEATLETALSDLNDYPGLKVRVDVRPGAMRGETDLLVTATERPPYTFGTDINNYGSRLTGPWVYGADVGIGNLAGLGDHFTGRYTKSDDHLFAFNLGYRIPVTGVGTTLSLAWSHSENVIGGEFASTRPTGRSDTVSADLLQTVRRTAGGSLTVNGGFDFKTSRNIVSGALSSKDELRIVRLGVRGDVRDAWLGQTYVGLTWHRGIEGLGGSNLNAPQTSLAGAGPGNWDKWTADVTRYQSLRLPFIQGLPVLPFLLNDSYLLLRATGQVAGDRLLSPERFSTGGYYTVRGYPSAEGIGDHGYTATAEWVMPLPVATPVPFSAKLWKDLVQVALFVDHGGTFVSPVTASPAATPQVFLTSAGAGLRINLPFGLPEPADRGALSLKIDWASAIGRPRPSSRDQGVSLNGVYGDGAAGVLYLSASMRF